MGTIDTSSWKLVGETSNAHFFEVESHVLAAVAIAGSSDDATTAVDNAAFHKRYFNDHGRGVLLVFTDTGKSQDAGARAVYSRAMIPQVYCAVAYVGGSALTRAAASFLIAFAGLKIPAKWFTKLEDALPWARERLAEPAASEM